MFMHVWCGGTTLGPPPPPLSDWAKLSPGLWPIKNFLWRPSAQVSLGQKFFFGAFGASNNSGSPEGGGVPPTAPPTHPPWTPPPYGKLCPRNHQLPTAANSQPPTAANRSQPPTFEVEKVP